MLSEVVAIAVAVVAVGVVDLTKFAEYEPGKAVVVEVGDVEFGEIAVAVVAVVAAAVAVVVVVAAVAEMGTFAVGPSAVAGIETEAGKKIEAVGEWRTGWLFLEVW